MIKNVSELKKLLIFARKQGIETLKVGGIEATFHKQSPTPQPQNTPLAISDAIMTAAQSLVEEDRQPSDDEMLFASTDYFDQLRASRKDAASPPNNLEDKGISHGNVSNHRTQ